MLVDGNAGLSSPVTRHKCVFWRNTKVVRYPLLSLGFVREFVGVNESRLRDEVGMSYKNGISPPTRDKLSPPKTRLRPHFPLVDQHSTLSCL